MSFSYNWNDVYPTSLHCGDTPGGTSCSPVGGYWGRTKASNPRIVDRERKYKSALEGYWSSKNYSNGNGSSAAMIQTLLNRAMRDARARGASGVPASLTVDGILGNASHAAIVWYQGRVGLLADGIVGNNTWQKLRYA